MILMLGLLVIALAAIFVVGRMVLRMDATLGARAWRAAMATLCMFVASVAVHEKPMSFTANFVAFPSLMAYAVGLLGVIATLAIGIAAGIRRDGWKRGLAAVAVALLGAVVAALIIQWRAQDTVEESVISRPSKSLRDGSEHDS